MAAEATSVATRCGWCCSDKMNTSLYTRTCAPAALQTSFVEWAVSSNLINYTIYIYLHTHSALNTSFNSCLSASLRDIQHKPFFTFPNSKKRSPPHAHYNQIVYHKNIPTKARESAINMCISKGQVVIFAHFSQITIFQGQSIASHHSSNSEIPLDQKPNSQHILICFEKLHNRYDSDQTSRNIMIFMTTQ